MSCCALFFFNDTAATEIYPLSLPDALPIWIPAACGTGKEGEIELDGLVEATDLNALRLSVPSGARAELVADGLVVLRSQGSLSVQGALVRRGNAAAEFDDPSGLSVTQWLERAQIAERPWTIPVAGGDLILPGRLLISGPAIARASWRVRV